MGVDQPVVIVEHHAGGDHTGGHHEHDAVEVCTWFRKPIISSNAKAQSLKDQKYITNYKLNKICFAVNSCLLISNIFCWF